MDYEMEGFPIDDIDASADCVILKEGSCFGSISISFDIFKHYHLRIRKKKSQTSSFQLQVLS
jgi:hypothetical protein